MNVLIWSCELTTIAQINSLLLCVFHRKRLRISQKTIKGVKSKLWPNKNSMVSNQTYHRNVSINIHQNGIGIWNFLQSCSLYKRPWKHFLPLGRWEMRIFGGFAEFHQSTSNQTMNIQLIVLSHIAFIFWKSTVVSLQRSIIPNVPHVYYICNTCVELHV